MRKDRKGGERGRRGRGETETKGEIDKEIGDQRGGSKEGMQEKANNSEKTGWKDKRRGTQKRAGMRQN